MALVVVLFASGFALPWARPAQDSKTEGKRAISCRPELSRELVERLKKGMDKLTEAVVLAMLGPPDLVEINTEPGVVADIDMRWEDYAEITIDFKIEGKSAGMEKAVRIVGRFSENLKQKSFNMENFRKLKPGMSHPEVGQILGGLGQRNLSDPGKDIWRWEWKTFRKVGVSFSNGKVSGVFWNL
jgi:hypothetical protein